MIIRGVARIFQRGGGGHTGSKNIVMAFSPPNIVGCLLKKRFTNGGHGHPRTHLATPLIINCGQFEVYNHNLLQINFACDR